MLDAGQVERIRQRIVVVTSMLGGTLALLFSVLESQKTNFDDMERYGLPGMGVFFLAAGLLAWWRWTRWAELAIVTAGGLLILERLHHVLHEPNPQLARVVDAYELIAWFPCLYLFGFLLFEKRWALLFSLCMLGGSVVILGDGVIGDSRGLYKLALHEYYASHLFCIGFIFALARLKERYVETHRVALALRSFAETDFLTGVANRRSLSEALAREVSRCERQKASLGVVLLDIDRFKRVNDTLGHEEGDRALRRVALLIDSHRRRSDLFGRWGGEEFLLVAPGLDLEGARQAAERLRAIVEESSRDTRAPITASFGVAEYVPGDDAATLVKRADEALIDAKSAGRNRVEARAA